MVIFHSYVKLAKGNWGWDDSARKKLAALRSEAREAPDARGPARDSRGRGWKFRTEQRTDRGQKSEEIRRNDDTTEKMFIQCQCWPVMIWFLIYSASITVCKCALGLLPCLLGHVRATMFRL